MPQGTTVQNVRNRIPRAFLTRNLRERKRHRRVDKDRMYNMLVANDLLREEAATEIEETLVRVARRDLVGVADLRNFGLDTPTEDGVGTTTWEFENVGAMDDITETMSILAIGDRDQADYELHSVPVPVFPKPFQLDRRQTAADDDISQVNVEEATRRVIDRMENVLTNGGSVTVGGNGIPGYTTLSARDTVALSTVWTTLQSNGNLDNAVEDVLTMKGNLKDSGYGGPYVLYVPSNYDTVIDDDYKAESGRTLRDRITDIDGIEEVKVLPALADDNVLLVQMTASVVEMPVGQEITPVTWDIMGGLATNWVVMSVASFALKIARDESDTNVAGISHLS